MTIIKVFARELYPQWIVKMCKMVWALILKTETAVEFVGK